MPDALHPRLVRLLEGGGWRQLVPIWEPDQTPNPLQRWAPAVPFWATNT
jgi:hypothetical protein